MKRNERDFAGQIISWIKKAIDEKRTIFQDATNDSGVKLDSGRTKFPDILLFVDKISGIIFNGWELKFPETSVDDNTMLKNALEKAEKIKSNSFVTWNGSEAIIWKINNEDYSITSLQILKHYPKEPTISDREDLSDPQKYLRNEKFLESRLYQILHDLENFLQSGEIKKAINISDEFINAIKDSSKIIIPQFKDEIKKLLGVNPTFRTEFNKWKMYESSTLKVLSSSSYRKENIDEQEILAKFTFYNLIGKIIFYLTLSDNLSGRLEKPDIKNSTDIKSILDSYFAAAKNIDYQAVFKPYFTDIVSFNPIISETIFELFNTITKIDFKVLPTDVIGNILENLVPKEEKQKFGQYFTPQNLANLVAFPTVKTNSDLVFDPTSGTGTFLNSFYQIFKYYGNNDHVELLNQIWGNDVSHFPSILSVINLYKQDLNITENFPRVMRDDFFNLEPGGTVEFPDSSNYLNKIELSLPKFNSITSNFPFIRQEDIPKDDLITLFEQIYEKTQNAFLKNDSFSMNEKSDYFTYCIYNANRFLTEDGFIGAITSNAWLGKEYGKQFKQFLLDNFHIKYIVRSNSEHWFSDSQVSTIFFILQKSKNIYPTKFVTLNFKLEEFFTQDNIMKQIKEIEDFYTQIELCDDEKNSMWEKDKSLGNLYLKKDKSVNVNIVEKEELLESVISGLNWDSYFSNSDIFQKFETYLCNPSDKIIHVSRGVRTGWNKMFVLSEKQIKDEGLDERFFVPYVKSPVELKEIKFDGKYKKYLFTCDIDENTLREEFPNVYRWIKKFENNPNSNGKKTIKEASHGKPYWYSKTPKYFNIVGAINLYERYFFPYSIKKFVIDQRFAGITVNEGYDVELIAALYNSIVTCVIVNFKGTSRSLGALDLNANYYKTLPILNPDLLEPYKVEQIKQAFRKLQSRNVEVIYEELKKEDRINFDKVILEAFGIDVSILDSLYSLIQKSAESRVEMKNK